MTAARQAGNLLGSPYTVSIPIITVTTVLLMEHMATLISPFVERWFFQGGDRQDIQLLQDVSDRLITTSDLREYLEAVLASVCDKFQVSSAFIAVLSDLGIENVIHVGPPDLLEKIGLDEMLLERASNGRQNVFAWGDFWLFPLYGSQNGNLLGIMGVPRQEDYDFEEGLSQTLGIYSQRAVMVLEDRQLQRQVFQALETLNPKMSMIQQMRAATRYDQRSISDQIETDSKPKDLSTWVKDALRHYWGGPKLTESPLLQLQVVQNAMPDHEDNPANALRAILKQGIESVKPEGERRFTAEWILYNILELKFMQGRKVREIAMRLAMSEADLYRKQRVAIEEVAKALVEMELDTRAKEDGGSL
jgi:hypothetical protein